MKIRNVHERSMIGSAEVAAELLDGLSGPNDRLWPRDQWPPMKLDAPLGVGSDGGHGPVRYRVSEYVAGRRVSFRFIDSGMTAGMHGGHYFEVTPDRERIVIRHVLEADCSFSTWLRWAVMIRPLHDALLEDALDGAERALNPAFSGTTPWSPWVRFLRFLIRRKNPGMPRDA